VRLPAGFSSAQQFSRSLLRCDLSDCGRAVTNPRHVRCDACIAADPAQAPEIRGRRGAAIAARKRALSEWDKANPGRPTTLICSGGHPAGARHREALRDRRGGRVLEGVRVRHQAREVDSACLDVGAARRSGRSGGRPNLEMVRTAVAERA